MYTETTTSGGAFSVAQAVTTTANSSNIYDITGAGAGNAPNMTGAAGVNTAIGSDMGAGDGVAKPQIIITNALTTAGTGAGDVTISIEAAPDNGSYSPGTYYQIGSFPAAIVGTTVLPGFQMQMDLPPIPPGKALPRFYRLVYTVNSTFAATFNANLVFNAPTVRQVTLYGNNIVAL